MGLFTTTTPAGDRVKARLSTFWFKVWGILIPVGVSVLGLMTFLITSSEIFFVTGVEYVLGELLMVLMPLCLLGLMIKDSLTLLYTTSVCNQAGIMVKVIGSQWYWNYEISDIEGVVFTSYMKSEEELMVGETRFLEVDNRLVLPVGMKIQFNITSSDVIHSFAVPTLGIKADATAGILNVVSTTMEKTGLHYGQCSEICGMNHSYMPIVIESTVFVSFYYWVLSQL